MQQTEGAVRQEAGMQPSVVGIQNAVQDHSFERTTPEALQSRNTGVSAPVDRTPAWAKVAQAKAHANKPEESRQSTSVGRSKFADTVAAQITAASTPLSPFVSSTQSYSTYTSPSNQQATRQGAASMWGQAQSSKQAQTQTTAEAEEPQSPLAARLASLRSEIESVEAPHLSKETKSAIDHMESEQQASAAQPVVIRPVATQQATEQPVVQATTRPVVSQQPVTTQTQATEPVVSQPVEQHPISQQAQSREQVEVQEVSQTPTPTAPMPVKESHADSSTTDGSTRQCKHAGFSSASIWCKCKSAFLPQHVFLLFLSLMNLQLMLLYHKALELASVLLLPISPNLMLHSSRQKTRCRLVRHRLFHLSMYLSTLIRNQATML